MILFFVFASLLVILVLALLLPVFNRQPDPAQDISRVNVNVSIARAQAAEAKQKFAAGEITEADYQQEKTRLEATLARDLEVEESAATAKRGQWMLWPVAAAVPIAAGALYMALGTPAAMDPANHIAPPAAQQQSAPSMAEIIERTKQQLAEHPDDVRGWYTLGIAQLNVGEYKEAETALREALQLEEGNAEVKIRLAEAIAIQSEGSWVGEPQSLLKSALETQADHPRALLMYGIAARESGDTETAIASWNKLLPLVSSDPRSKSEIENLIASAGGQVVAGDNAPSEPENTVTIVVEVTVKDGLATDLPPETPVFIYAKAVNGPPMPLAAVKRSLGELPVTVSLSDAQAMVASMTISSFEEVIVGARISRSGDPIAKPGDLYAESEAVATGVESSTVQITISDVLP